MREERGRRPRRGASAFEKSKHTHTHPPSSHARDPARAHYFHDETRAVLASWCSARRNIGAPAPAALALARGGTLAGASASGSGRGWSPRSRRPSFDPRADGPPARVRRLSRSRSSGTARAAPSPAASVVAIIRSATMTSRCDPSDPARSAVPALLPPDRARPPRRRPVRPLVRGVSPRAPPRASRLGASPGKRRDRARAKRCPKPEIRPPRARDHARGLPALTDPAALSPAPSTPSSDPARTASDAWSPSRAAAPKPINLPSQRRENNDQDPNVTPCPERHRTRGTPRLLRTRVTRIPRPGAPSCTTREREPPRTPAPRGATAATIDPPPEGAAPSHPGPPPARARTTTTTTTPTASPSPPRRRLRPPGAPPGHQGSAPPPVSAIGRPSSFPDLLGRDLPAASDAPPRAGPGPDDARARARPGAAATAAGARVRRVRRPRRGVRSLRRRRPRRRPPPGALPVALPVAPPVPVPRARERRRAPRRRRVGGGPRPRGPFQERGVERGGVLGRGGFLSRGALLVRRRQDPRVRGPGRSARRSTRRPRTGAGTRGGLGLFARRPGARGGRGAPPPASHALTKRARDAGTAAAAAVRRGTRRGSRSCARRRRRARARARAARPRAPPRPSPASSAAPTSRSSSASVPAPGAGERKPWSPAGKRAPPGSAGRRRRPGGDRGSAGRRRSRSAGAGGRKKEKEPKAPPGPSPPPGPPPPGAASRGGGGARGGQEEIIQGEGARARGEEGREREKRRRRDDGEGGEDAREGRDGREG